jgi:hypothetical protein
MPVATKIEPLGKELSILIDDTLSPRAQSEAFAGFARSELREAQTINGRALGRVPAHKTWVDGRAEAPLETVKPDGGRIVFRFEIVADVLIFVAATLREKSPVGPPAGGHYRDSHQLFADGVLVPGGPQAAPPAALYVFLNPTPYSRKIEAGLMKMAVPGTDHVYEQTRQIAASRFGNVATIRFTYQAAAGGDRVPALIVTPR